MREIIPAHLLDAKTHYYVNPTGRFVIGGPMGDAGLTGRKIIVDTYGGMARHGGGAFSGKDPTKVDRSAAYAARHVAKNVVAAGLADRCEIQISYAIGVAHPTSLAIETFGTNKVSDELILEAGPGALRPAARRHHSRPAPAPSDLPADGRLRPLRPRGHRRTLGGHGQGEHAATRGRPHRLRDPDGCRLTQEGPYLTWHPQEKPPSEVEIVIAWHEALNDGDIDRLIALSRPDVEVGDAAGSRIGPEAVREWFGTSGLNLELGAFLQRGEVVVVSQEAQWVAAAGGEGQVRAVASVFRVRAGLIASIIQYEDLDAALVGAGIKSG